MIAPGRNGQVVTFYSYKGGTGRSMLLANVAWILACNGCRVLAIDWDLEAPGLHRYFSPFLLDKELNDTDGVIDFVIDFQVTATMGDRADAGSDEEWFLPYADLTSYAQPLQWEFPSDGALDFVGAGRQGPSYSTRVNGVGWGDFYERFGGGAFIDAAKRFAKERYDYVLVDSRTGVSDAAGICTVQLPDVLVVLFTLNNQSIDGAAGVARSVQTQRGTTLKILPVPTRIENAEKDKRDLRRERAMRQFGALLPGIDHEERLGYWSDAAVVYEPYYAYEELLATFRDEPGLGGTLLASAENLTRLITELPFRSVRSKAQARAQVLAAYEGTAQVQPAGPHLASPGGIYIAYRSQDRGRVDRLYDALARSVGPDRVFIDLAIQPGVDWAATIDEAINAAEVVLVIIGPDWRADGVGDYVAQEIAAALERDRRVIPVLVGGAVMPSAAELPHALDALARRNSITLSDARWSYDVDRLIAAIEVATARKPTGLASGYAEAPLRTSVTSDQVIESVLKTERINWVSIALAVVSVVVSAVVLLTQVFHVL